MRKVIGSSPISSTKKELHPFGWSSFYCPLDSNPSQYRCPADICRHQFKNRRLLYNLSHRGKLVFESYILHQKHPEILWFRGVFIVRHCQAHPVQRLILLSPKRSLLYRCISSLQLFQQIPFLILDLHIFHDFVVINRIGRAAQEAHHRHALNEFQQQHVHSKGRGRFPKLFPEHFL